LTAGLLFIHTVLGCCWHHAHRWDGRGAALVAEKAHCCPHHDDQKSQQPGPDDCRQERCETCTYLLPQKVLIDSPQSAQFLAALDLAAVLPQAADTIGLGASRRGFCAGLFDAAPPLRLHLLHQTLRN
jgi:hypothetical protein